jgi:hypothetical protein
VAQLFSLGITAMPRIIPSFLLSIGLVVALLSAGCGGFGFAYQKKLSGKYGLVAVDELHQMEVAEMLPSGDAIGVIPATVFAVGWDEHFIIAKQHPMDADHHTDSLVTKFYILQVSDGTLFGPFDEPAFNAERVKRAVSEGLSFTLVFDSLK